MSFPRYESYKDSGEEWLGEVPAHWRVGAIKRFMLQKPGAIKTGPFGSHLTSIDMQSGEIKVYNQRSVIDNDFISGENFITAEKFRQLAGFQTFPGDLLITTRGTIGRAAILPENAERGILHPCLLRMQPDNSRVYTQFLRLLIQDSDLLKHQLNYLSNATTIEVIYSETIASVVIPLPPLPEQEAILAFLNCETAKIEGLIMESYFDGKPPFKSQKVRDDIPDAFIFQCIVNLSSSAPLLIVVEDEGLAKSCETISGITVFRTLQALIESSSIQEEIIELDVVRNLPAIASLFQSYEIETQGISNELGENARERLQGERIYSGFIPDDNNEGVITGCWHIEDIKLDFENLYYFGQGKFGLPFKFKQTVAITYYVFKADFYSIPEHTKNSVSDQNDHYFEVVSDFVVDASGLAELSIPPSVLNTVNPGTLDESLEVEIDSIDNIDVVEQV